MAIQIRRGTKAEWDANNSNIVAGEPAIALDTGDVFVGTGTGTYVELASKEYVDSHSGGGGITEEAKIALLACFKNVVWGNDDGQAYVDALENALYPPANVRSISAVYTQSGTVYDTDSLDSLRTDLVVTAYYDDSTIAVVTTYALSGTLAEGTSIITVSYGGKTTTFNVTVSATPHILENGTHDFSDGTKVTVLNDHVTIKIGTTSQGRFINLSSLSTNGTSAGAQANVNNLSATYASFSNGDDITLSVTNATFNYSGGTGEQDKIAINFRKQNASTSIMSTACELYAGHNTESTQTYSVTQNVVASCLFAYIGSSVSNGNTIDFNITYSVE